jgi:signal peptidase I
MPGDTIFSRDGVVHINGVPQRLGYESAVPGGNPGSYVDPMFSVQRAWALDSSRFGPAPAQPTLDDWGPLAVPDGHFWMMGDNRYQSMDSRWYGMVPRDRVRGRPVFVYYSWNANDSDRPLPFLTDIRWSRIGHVIR